jgi:hypothetical protein
MKENYFGIMIDCSRGAVMKVEKVKEYVDYLALFGYNMLSLYTEDTFLVDNEPRFGYLRGAYTKDEIKEIDAYCVSKGIELVPCIQTLAHLNQIFLWSEYQEINDCNEILLVGEEKTYKFLDNVLKTVRECFSSNLINIGMDEAHMLGLGKYLDKNGYQNRFSILKSHLGKVNEMVKSYNFKPMMWSDMFFRFANEGDYYGKNMTEEARSSAPKDVSLVYWDYYHVEYEEYDRLIKMHKTFDNEVWFAGGAWMWRGFAPHNDYSMETMIPAMKALKDNNVKNIFFTMWGDDGKECSSFAVLPALFKLKKIYDGETDEELIKKEFKELTGADFDGMMNLDLPNKVGEYAENNNPCKYLFYNDIFLGIFDSTLKGTEREEYLAHANKLFSFVNGGKFDYLYETLGELCLFLSIKSTIGLKLRNAYKNKDKKTLKILIKDITLMQEHLNDFYNSFLKLWSIENKSYGIEVHNARIGGAICRIEYCKQLLIKYVKGKIDKIEDLEAEILDYETGKKEFSKKTIMLNSYLKSFSTNNSRWW